MELQTCTRCGVKYSPYGVPTNLRITLPNGKHLKGFAIPDTVCLQCAIEAAALNGITLSARLEVLEYPLVKENTEKQITKASLKKTWEQLEPWKDLL